MEQIEYECAGVTVTVDAAAVVGMLDRPLAPEVAALFVEAAKRAGVAVVDGTAAWVEAWPSQPQPWPVFLAVDGEVVADFLAVGGEVVAEFYPVGWRA